MAHCKECKHFTRTNCAEPERAGLDGKVAGCPSFEAAMAFPMAKVIKVPSMPPHAWCFDTVPDPKPDQGTDRFSIERYRSMIKMPTVLDLVGEDDQMEYMARINPLIREVWIRQQKAGLLRELVEVLDISEPAGQVDHLARMKAILKTYRAKGAI